MFLVENCRRNPNPNNNCPNELTYVGFKRTMIAYQIHR